MFHRTLPEVLTGLGVVHPEDEGVLLFFALEKVGVGLDLIGTEERIMSQWSNIQHVLLILDISGQNATVAQFLYHAPLRYKRSNSTQTEQSFETPSVLTFSVKTKLMC